MPDLILTPKKLQARVQSTSELLHAMAQETDQTVSQLKISDLSAELWFRYRQLAASIHTTAGEAANLTQLLRNLTRLPALKHQPNPRPAA